MYKIFKCDCSTHLLEFEYLEADKDFNFEEISLIIREVYNPKTGRKYKIPRILADVALLNNAAPKELDYFFDFMEKIIKNRKKSKRIYNKKISPCMKELDKSIKRIKIDNKKKDEENKKRLAKIKKQNRKKKK